MNNTISIKQLSQELKVSEQALRQWCKKNNIRKERTQGTKASYVIAFDAEKQIRAYYSGESNETKAETNERKDRKQSNETKETIKTEVTSQATADDLQTEYIETLKAQLALLSEQLTVKDSQINTLTAEIEQERKERQTILAELLHLRGQKRIDIKAAPSRSEQPRPKEAATFSSQDKPKQKLSFRDKIRAAADIFRK